MTIEKCPRCAGAWRTVRILKKGPHLGIYCANFGHWIRWVRKSDAEILKKLSESERKDVLNQ